MRSRALFIFILRAAHHALSVVVHEEFGMPQYG